MHSLMLSSSLLLSRATCFSQVRTFIRHVSHRELARAFRLPTWLYDPYKIPDEHRELESFDPIYRFPYIVGVGVFCRLKLAQTGLTVILVPTTAVLASTGYASFETFTYTSGLSAFACVMLYVMSELTRRTIGAIYKHRREDVIRVAYLSFWGRRRDMYIPIKDVVPLADASESPSDVYIKFRRYSTKDVLYFTLRYGRILDMEKFQSVFGQLLK